VLLRTKLTGKTMCIINDRPILSALNLDDNDSNIKAVNTVGEKRGCFASLKLIKKIYLEFHRLNSIVFFDSWGE
jgi:hypothetical protein